MSVDIEAVDAADEIVLNAAEIEIVGATIGDDAVAGVSYDEEYERATLELSETLAPGHYRLDIEYTGLINDQLRGLYRSTFTDPDGVETHNCHLTVPGHRCAPCPPLLG